MPIRPFFASLALLVPLAACGHHDDTPPSPPPASLASSYDMIGKDGRKYGTVEMDPIGGGRVIDSSGRVIGDIVVPDRRYLAVLARLEEFDVGKILLDTL